MRAFMQALPWLLGLIAPFAIAGIVAGLAYDQFTDSGNPVLDGFGTIVLLAGAATLVVAGIDHIASARTGGSAHRISTSRLRTLGKWLALSACLVFVVGTYVVIASKDVEPTDLITGLGSVDELQGTAAELKGTTGELVETTGDLDDTVDALNVTSGELKGTTSALGDVVEATTMATNDLTYRVDDVEASAVKAVAAAQEAEAAAESVSDAAMSLTSSLDDLGSDHAELDKKLDAIIERLDSTSAAPASSIGACARGLDVQIGESCSLPDFDLEFVVSESGASLLAPAGAEPQRGYIQADLVVRGEPFTFQAVEESDGRWQVFASGPWQGVLGLGCQVGDRIEPGEYCTWRGNTLRVYATNDFAPIGGARTRFTRGYAHLDLQYYRDAVDDHVISVSDNFEDKQGNPVSHKFIGQRDPESENYAWIIVCAD